MWHFQFYLLRIVAPSQVKGVNVVKEVSHVNISQVFTNNIYIYFLEQTSETFLNALTKQCPRSEPRGLKVACGYVRVENGKLQCLQGDCMATRSYLFYK